MNYTKSLILAIAFTGIMSAPALAATQNDKEKAIKVGKIALKTGIATASLASAAFIGFLTVCTTVECIKMDNSTFDIAIFALPLGTTIASATYVGIKSAQSAINDTRNFNK